MPAPGFVTVNGCKFDRTPQLNLGDLLDSLGSEDESIRESALYWLAGARSSENPVTSDEIAEICRRVHRIQERDESERVRTGASKALAELQCRIK